MANMKTCPTSYMIRKLQTNTTMKYPMYLLAGLKSRTLSATKTGEEVG
jgi:hypothetical protein